jgi:hypothetical protein
MIMNSRTKQTTEVDVVDGDTTVNLPKSRRTNIALTEPTPMVHKDSPAKKALTLVSLLVTVVLLYKIGTILYERKVTTDLVKKTTACPTLLSISRSARDTLLVMRSEPLCAAYVLDSIQ